MIPMLDIARQDAALRPEIEARIAAVVASGQFVFGAELEAFEHEVAEYLGVAHALGCGSGTAALHLALLAGGVGAGDEVVTPAFTFAGTAEAICHAGARPVFVDIDPATFTLDPARVAAALTPRTAAVIAVHLYGQPADLDTLRALCDARGLLLVEDCAQAFGARSEGRRVGSVGDCGCFSFYPAKNLGAYGDGGLVCTSSDDLARRVRMLRNHGGLAPYEHTLVGYTSRLDALQAAVLRVKLRHVDAFNAERRAVAARYTALLAELPLQTPVEARPGSHVFHQYTILCEARDALARELARADVASAVHYRVPLHRQPAFRDFAAESGLPVSDDVARRCLSLPIHPAMPAAHVVRVAEAVAAALA